MSEERVPRLSQAQWLAPQLGSDWLRLEPVDPGMMENMWQRWVDRSERMNVLLQDPWGWVVSCEDRELLKDMGAYLVRHGLMPKEEVLIRFSMCLMTNAFGGEGMGVYFGLSHSGLKVGEPKLNLSFGLGQNSDGQVMFLSPAREEARVTEPDAYVLAHKGVGVFEQIPDYADHLSLVDEFVKLVGTQPKNKLSLGEKQSRMGLKELDELLLAYGMVPLGSRVKKIEAEVEEGAAGHQSQEVLVELGVIRVTIEGRDQTGVPARMRLLFQLVKMSPGYFIGAMTLGEVEKMVSEAMLGEGSYASFPEKLSALASGPKYFEVVRVVNRILNQARRVAEIVR